MVDDLRQLGPELVASRNERRNRAVARRVERRRERLRRLVDRPHELVALLAEILQDRAPAALDRLSDELADIVQLARHPAAAFDDLGVDLIELADVGRQFFDPLAQRAREIAGLGGDDGVELLELFVERNRRLLRARGEGAQHLQPVPGKGLLQPLAAEREAGVDPRGEIVEAVARLLRAVGSRLREGLDLLVERGRHRLGAFVELFEELPIASFEEAVELLEALMNLGRKLVDGRVEPLGQSAAARREHAVHGFEALTDFRDERLRGFGEALRLGGKLVEQRAAFVAQSRADRYEAFLENIRDVLGVLCERRGRLLNVLVESLRVRLERLRMLCDALADAIAALRQRLFQESEMRLEVLGDGVAALRQRLGGLLTVGFDGGLEMSQSFEQILGDAFALHGDRHNGFAGRRRET